MAFYFWENRDWACMYRNSFIFLYNQGVVQLKLKFFSEILIFIYEKIYSIFVLYLYIYRNFQYQLYYGISCINKTDLIIEFYYLLLLMQKNLLLIRTIDNELVLNTWNNLSTQPITINLSLAL